MAQEKRGPIIILPILEVNHRIRTAPHIIQGHTHQLNRAINRLRVDIIMGVAVSSAATAWMLATVVDREARLHIRMATSPRKVTLDHSPLTHHLGEPRVQVVLILLDILTKVTTDSTVVAWGKVTLPIKVGLCETIRKTVGIELLLLPDHREVTQECIPDNAPLLVSSPLPSLQRPTILI